MKVVTSNCALPLKKVVLDHTGKRKLLLEENIKKWKRVFSSGKLPTSLKCMLQTNYLYRMVNLYKI
jgi:hypothetical protein